MKNKLTTLIILLITIQFSFGQNGRLFREKREQIKSIKVAYITNELSLTPEESAKFWPLYNAFEEKQQDIRKQKLKGYLDRIDDESFDNLSEKEAAAMLTQMENTEDELYQLRKKFIANLKSVLPASKILKLKKAEEGFNRKLLQQYRDKRLGR
ncbi:sensor of ECF-type sigma factor [Flavobacterium sp.]|jgi:Spy/CpxP family protein refolding chaperone|uniref:sensor of ECF-type sigma factor n=1 Tax=Flavobacterium sp. TaxID=239 RepID=UPI0035B4BC0E